ncbi:hypothetical protein [Sphingomonas sp.]|uniref:phage tail tube protein n=1 Tax=Sphingomonas sp. TaxID=28214 RepID=UPI002DD689DC|nr:hypothetical protein [Sphingomonas sp.]
MADYSYIGSGRTYLREIGGSAGLVEVGNCSALSFGVTEDTKELKDYTQPGGGTYNEVRRISAVEATMTIHDINAENLARALYGSTSAVTTAAITDEAHADIVLGAFIPTTHLPSAIGAVKKGATVLAENTDYEVRPSGIIPLGGALSAGDDITISYTKAAADVVQALTSSGKEYELVFDGLNEARSGKRTRVTAYRVKPGALQSLGLIGEDYGALEVTGKVLKDTTKIGAGVSQYFKVEIEK